MHAPRLRRASVALLATLALPISAALAQTASGPASASASAPTAAHASAAFGAPPAPAPELLVPPQRATRAPGLHPTVVLRDEAGELVMSSGRPLSPLSTCGHCHDGRWIAEHGYHFRLGVDEQVEPGRARSGRAWDFGPGLFGRWDPLAGYDAVLAGAKRQDRAAIDAWVDQNAQRMLGGGPTLKGDRARSFEPACVVCHVAGARVPARAELGGDLGSFSTAALLPLGVVTLDVPRRDADVAARPARRPPLAWVAAAFQPDGSLDPGIFRIGAPTSEACGACHGLVSQRSPRLGQLGVAARSTETTGAVFSPARISASELNVAARGALTRPWDVHAERLLECADCHFSPNDPASTFPLDMPGHLRHDARHVPFGEFLRRPSHELAKGRSSQGTVAAAHDGTMRRCEDCHRATETHAWLPRAERHLAQIGCESCHIGALHAPARKVTDFSVPDARGRPRLEYRGVVGELSDPGARVEGYTPVLLRRDEPGGRRLMPYNLVATFFWIVDDQGGPRPASLDLLQRAFHGGGRASELRAALDRDADGVVSDAERVLDTEARVALARELLEAAGAKNPRLEGELQPFGVHHGVGPASTALRDCGTCHAASSRLVAPIELAERSPFGVVPALVGDAELLPAYSIGREAEGRLSLTPSAKELDLHVLGLSRSGVLDGLGLLLFGMTVAGAALHGGLRARARSRSKRST